MPYLLIRDEVAPFPRGKALRDAHAGPGKTGGSRGADEAGFLGRLRLASR